MKKIIITTLLFLVGCNLEVKVKPQEANAQPSQILVSYPFSIRETHGNIIVSYFNESNMKYALIYTSHGHSYAGDAISVINITKDSLEVKLLKNKLSDTLGNYKVKRKK